MKTPNTLEELEYFEHLKTQIIQRREKNQKDFEDFLVDLEKTTPQKEISFEDFIKQL